MKRGTRVAQAYTEMHVDGSEMNEEIVDAVEDASPGVEKAGKKAGKKYGDGFSDEFYDRMTKRIGKRLDKSLDRTFKRAGKNLGKSMADQIGKALDQRMEEFGRMIDSMEDALKGVSGNRSGGGGGGRKSGKALATKDIDNIYPAFEAARVKLHETANKTIVAADKALIKTQNQRYKDQMDLEKAKTAFIGKMSAAVTKMRAQSNATILKDDQNLFKEQEKLYKKLEREAQKQEKATARRLTGRRSMGDRTGALFGAGSRNNALNLLGRTIGNVVDLTDNAVRGAGRLGSAFVKGFSQAAEGAGFFQKVVAGFGENGLNISKMFTSIAATGPGAVVALAAIIATMSLLVSVASALLAILTALISTIVSGLVGALAVLGGAMAAVIAAGGLLTAAFMSMNDAQKKYLKDTFAPLRAEMVGIGQIMLKEMIPAFATWSTNLQRALALAIPVAQVMGKAFAEAGNTLTASFSGPGFQAFANALGVWLPSIVTRLSAALGSFLNGTLGLFAALMPFVNQFAGYLALVAERFSKWANSAQGKNAIVDFTTRALASLQSLWNFIREFTGFLADVLFSADAQNFGNGMFDGLAESFERLRQKIADGALEQWFKDAAAFGKGLWAVLGDLWAVLKGFYSSGVLQGLGKLFGALSWAIELLTGLSKNFRDVFGFGISDALNMVLSPITIVINALNNLADTARWAINLLDKIPGVNMKGGTKPILGQIGDAVNGAMLTGGATSGASAGSAAGGSTGLDVNSVINSGNKALAGTDLKDAKYVNPYKKWAESLIKEGPSIAAQIRSAMKNLNRQIESALREASNATTLAGARSALTSVYKDLRAQGKSLVDAARSSLNSAAQNLASASSPGEAAKALKEVQKAQKDLEKALKAQNTLNKAANTVAKQKVVRSSVVSSLLKGFQRDNATLAEYARAQEILAVKIQQAKDKLISAIALRDDYKQSVIDSTRAFGDLTTAQAQTINGVEQALTATDITSNLQSRLDKIRAFQANLRILLAQGLSNSAYKQIVDQGVEGGGAYAEALVAGGQGAVAQVNGLVSQIDAIANNLGTETSNRLYQAGVDAAQGLVDGLTSLSAQLDSAAARLGDSIARALKKSLGIKSPSRVMIAAMNDVGDGIEGGLDAQALKVSAASARLSSKIRVSPEVAAHAASVGDSPYVSGNNRDIDVDITVVTPTEDPHAVATEVLNELVERL